MKKAAQLDKDPIIPLFFKYYLPTLISLLSVTIHQIIDGIILAKYVGKAGVAAVGLFGPVITVFIAFLLTLVIGGGILISKNLGANNVSKAQEVFQFTTSWVAVVSGIIFIIAPFFVDHITAFLVGEEKNALYTNTYDYLFYGFLWLPFFFVKTLWGNAVTHDNAPKVARNASILAVVLNITLDIVFIIIFPFGTKGASIATGLSVLISSLYLFIYLYSDKGDLSLKRFKFSLNLKEKKELFNHGIPSFLSEITFSAGLLLMNKTIVFYGTSAVAAFGLINHLSFIFLRLFTGAMIAVLPIISFNIGAKLPKRVIAILKFSLSFTFLLGIVVVTIGFNFSGFLIDLFSGEETKDFKDMATSALGLFFILFLAAGPNYILGAFFQSTGKSLLSITLYILKGLVLLVLFLFVLPDLWDLGLNGVWLSRSFAEIGTLLLIGIFTLIFSKRYFSESAIVK